MNEHKIATEDLNNLYLFSKYSFSLKIKSEKISNNLTIFTLAKQTYEVYKPRVLHRS